MFCHSNLFHKVGLLHTRNNTWRNTKHCKLKHFLLRCSSVQFDQRLYSELLLVKQWLEKSPKVVNSLENGTWVKLICGASYQDLPFIRNLSFLFALAGVDCIDCAADSAVVRSVDQGIVGALAYANRFRISLKRPLIMISINDDEDPHFRKASFDTSHCPPDCSKPCERVCPASAIALQSDQNGFLIPFHQGVIQNKCYGCGRCVPVCPVQNIETTLFSSCHGSVIDSLLESEPIDAIEIHSRAESIQHFKQLWDSIGPSFETHLSLVSISFPDGGEYLEEFLRTVERIIVKESTKYQVIWQADGKPMSGDIGRGTTMATVKLAKKVLSLRLRGYVQCAGGVNDYTISVLNELDLRPRKEKVDTGNSVAGIAFGSFARRRLIELLQRNSFDDTMNVENSSCFEQAWNFVFHLVKPIKQG
jgi:Fe-S-cluster-containing hydrogenase component 2